MRLLLASFIAFATSAHAATYSCVVLQMSFAATHTLGTMVIRSDMGERETVAVGNDREIRCRGTEFGSANALACQFARAKLGWNQPAVEATVPENAGYLRLVAEYGDGFVRTDCVSLSQ